MTAPPATHKTITVLRTTEHSLGLSPTMRKPAVYGSELTYLVTWCEGGTLVLNFKKNSINFKSGSPQTMKCQEKVWTVRRCLVSPLSHCNTWNLNKKQSQQRQRKLKQDTASPETATTNDRTPLFTHLRTLANAFICFQCFDICLYAVFTLL